jgi:type III restriction enzyme
MILKDYQEKSLYWLEMFFKRCKETNNPATAYSQTTQDWLKTALVYRPLPTLPDIPYVCLRIPTGGGKTLVGGMAIEKANQSLLYTSHSVTLWLVPSEPIREQTLKALKTTTNLLHQAVFSSLGDVTILEIDEALRVKPAVLNGSNVIIVATMQSFKQEDINRLNVYKQNSEMMPHFEDVADPSVRGNLSLVDVLRMRRPFVIIDEAHNQGTALAFDTLARFEPSAILELTATPDRSKQPSNVLFSVGASALQAEDMIKMPLELVRRENWQDALRDAIGRLNRLQTLAAEETKDNGDYLRPIMLLQAERSDAERDTLVPEKVKQALIEHFHIAPEEIAIATGVQDDLSGVDVLSPQSQIRFIITIDKLREGWDCPFAYVLCSFRNTNSITAAEQILGRILRMPGAKRKTHPELNEAYAFVTSTDFQATVAGLKEGLVKIGFERQETRDLIITPEESGNGDLFTPAFPLSFTPPDLPLFEALPDALKAKIEVVPETGIVTIKEDLPMKQIEALEAAFPTVESKTALRQALSLAQSPAPHQKTPSENGEEFHVPELSIKQGSLWETFEETHLLQGEWRLLDYPAELTENVFKKPEGTVQGGRFVLDHEKIKFSPLEHLETQLALLDFPAEWDQVQLVYWLERNIPVESISPDEKAAFLNHAIDWLITSRNFNIAELNYSRFKLRTALEANIGSAMYQAKKKVYQALLASPEQFLSDGCNESVFKAGRYAHDFIYSGFVTLPKHFFPQIGNLQAKGEEFECAQFLANELQGVKFWVRNVERKPTSFSLQTSTDRFYPDFLCQLEDGRVLIVEYKNSRDYDLPDNEEKRQLGELWEKRSKGKGLFIMPRGKDWAAIKEKSKSK